MKSIDEVMRYGIDDKVFPGAQLIISQNNKILFDRAYGVTDLYCGQNVLKDTVFDLASFTKPLATTLAVMKLIQEHRLETGSPAGIFLPELKNTEKGSITIRELLLHMSGLPPHRPFYERLCRFPVHLRKKMLLKMICDEPLQVRYGAAVYSDLGFMLLGMIVEEISGDPMDLFLYEKVYKPMGLKDLFFVDLASGAGSCPGKRVFASTESCPLRKKILNGEVHDDNAHAVGGVMGHAGLFGTGSDVNMLLDDLINSFHGRRSSGIFNRGIVCEFFERDDASGRTLGFDTPSVEKSSSGSFFSENSVGHLGFTGTSFWIDLPRSISVVLLTNRVHPSRKNNKIRAFRPLLHNTVMRSIQQF